MASEFDVPDIFHGEVPLEFYEEAINRHNLPRGSRTARALRRLLFNRPPQEPRLTDMVVRSLYRQALAQRGEAEARAQSALDQYDEVTGLPNRRYFRLAGDELLGSIGGHRRSSVIGFLIDVVDFGQDINNLYGHPQGDAALRDDVAAFLQGAVRSELGDLVGRWGGDEFGILIALRDPGAKPEALARTIGGRLVNIPFTEPTQPKQIRLRRAIAEPGMTTDDVMAAADMKGPKKDWAIYSRINPAYLSADLSLLE